MKNDQKRLSKLLILPDINNEKNEENKNHERSSTNNNNNNNNNINKKLDSLHKDININSIFDSFKNILSINENKIKKSELDILNENSIIKSNFSKINNSSILYKGAYGYLPKLNSTNDSSMKLNKDSSEYWSPIDGIREKDYKNKIISPKKLLQGFSTKNRQINFKKHDSIFLTNKNNPILKIGERNSSLIEQKSFGNITLMGSCINTNSTLKDKMFLTPQEYAYNQTGTSSIFDLEN
jgi:hypothetical protein